MRLSTDRTSIRLLKRSGHSVWSSATPPAYMLVDAESPKARSAVHLVFVKEKVRRDYIASVPEFSSARNLEGLLVAPVADLVRMKLTSFRLKDRVHIQDMDGVGLITAEIEASLPEVLRERLAQVRATE